MLVSIRLSMVKVTLQTNCSECGNSYIETKHMSQGSLLARGIDLGDVDDSHKQNPVHMDVNSCQSHAGLTQI
jgi:hypothetical protein